jgi:hypothetical protein
MSEILKKPDFLLMGIPVHNSPVVKKRGRPKGAKNKVKSLEAASDIPLVKKQGRGRPKGSKNKPKVTVDLATQPAGEPYASEPKKRGRPKGSKNKLKSDKKRKT